MNGIDIRQFWLLFLEQIRGIYFSDLMIILIAAVLVCFGPGYILHIKKGTPVLKIVHVFFIVLYAGVILLITMLRREPGSAPGRIYTHLNLGFTKTRIYSMRDTIYSLLNFMLFVPWGILIGLRRIGEGPVRIIIMTTLTGFLTSFSIEVVQHISRRGNFEVTDLFTNVAGSFFGALCVIVLAIIVKRMKK
ncbi:VanZ family protein [Butyrivibrio sp. VCD2006]|uniref:VanZ family protein n=1 Tax=Butyrivibrio sp. VCD2006 TaxID=1280664 RepID=UPI00047C60FE|nr:VanZ family protein [Butyrivibrio sp. VCD2006]